MFSTPRGVKLTSMSWEVPGSRTNPAPWSRIVKASESSISMLSTVSAFSPTFWTVKVLTSVSLLMSWANSSIGGVTTMLGDATSLSGFTGLSSASEHPVSKLHPKSNMVIEVSWNRIEVLQESDHSIVP